MDLEYEGFQPAARELIDTYVECSKDDEIYILLDFYKCYRAVVRSKTTYLSLLGMEADKYLHKRFQRKARSYLSLAYRYALRFTRPTLWVVCGLPASGKSTLAAELAAILHVEILSSDRVRKQLFGVGFGVTVDVAFEQGIYSPAATALVYGKLLLLAQEELKKGASVILDAAFGREGQRREAMQLARDTDSNILFVECAASPPLLEQRLVARESSPPLSDARAHHLPDMIGVYRPFEGLGRDLHLRVDMEAPIREAVRNVLRYDHYLISARGGPS
jgi:predicted kinase